MDRLLEFAVGVKAADREIRRRMNDLLRPHGITAPQAEAILVIGKAGPLSLKDLGELVVAEAGHPSRLVDRLVEAGHVRRRACDDDRRRVELSLTPTGQALCGHILRAQRTLLDWGEVVLAGHDLTATLAALHAVLADGPLAETMARHRADAAELSPDPEDPPLPNHRHRAHVAYRDPARS